MHFIDASSLRSVLDFPSLMAALRVAFSREWHSPQRSSYEIGSIGRCLLMPAWRAGEFLGVKIANVFPGNKAVGLPTVNAVYLLMCGQTGRVLATMDGDELTALRTAAVSALAADLLARPGARHVLIVGAGRVAKYLALAHAQRIAEPCISIWARDHVKARALANELGRSGLSVDLSFDLAFAVERADIVSCATLATEPLIRGQWLRPGVHLDLVGSFTRNMRESDDLAVARSVVFVDEMGAANIEAGDIVQPLMAGVITPSHVKGDLAALCSGACSGRRADEDITMFKSVGLAVEDIAAAVLAYERLVAGPHAG